MNEKRCQGWEKRRSCLQSEVIAAFCSCFPERLAFLQVQRLQEVAFASGKGQKMSFRPGQGACDEVRKVSGFGNWEVGDPFSFR